MSSLLESEQLSLLQPEELHNVRLISEIDGYDVPTYYGPKGSYVQTELRAKYLITALVSMSERNIRDGFSLAPYEEAYSVPIWKRYRRNTNDVVDGASSNRNTYQDQLRVAFWRATGAAAMRSEGLASSRWINAKSQKDWRDFNKAYGHPDDLGARNSYIKVLAGQIGEKALAKGVIKRARNRESFVKPK